MTAAAEPASLGQQIKTAAAASAVAASTGQIATASASVVAASASVVASYRLLFSFAAAWEDPTSALALIATY